MEGDSEETSSSLPVQLLRDFGLSKDVATKLCEIWDSVKECFQSEHTWDALKELPADGALAVFNEFAEDAQAEITSFSLCQKINIYSWLRRKAYKLSDKGDQVGPPLGWVGPLPPAINGHEIYCTGLPLNIGSERVGKIFSKCGNIWNLQLVHNPNEQLGHAFLLFQSPEEALQAVTMANSMVIDGSPLHGSVTRPNRRIFVGRIPKSKRKEELITEFEKVTANLRDARMLPNRRGKSRGYWLLEYSSQGSASDAKTIINNNSVQLFNKTIWADWADPRQERTRNSQIQNNPKDKVEVLMARAWRLFQLSERISLAQ